MPRKRKIPLKKIAEDDETIEDGVDENENTENMSVQHGPMYNIMSNVQLCETFHNKYIKEMKELYRKMDHDAFMFTFIKMVKSAMESEESNEYANTTLLFCAKFVSSYQGDATHEVLLDIFKWITTTISTNPHIRYRLCQFVNIILRALGPEAALDDSICDCIMNYMICRLSDINPNVRVQAILALQRLQNPDNPDDVILKTYQFHLCSDPSPKVRMAVITSIGRNFNTIPYILERLWDIDEKVRRHTYLNMSSYPVRSYKVVQRLTFLEQGLNDRSEMVKKVVTSVMLPQWLESYNKDYIELISALKLDSNEKEIERFLKTTKLALKEMFKKSNIEDLTHCLPIERDDLENEFYKCVKHENLSVEISIYWVCLIEYMQQQMADEIDLIIPELSTFCSYILKFCELRKFNNDDDKWRKMENQYILLGLIEIVHTFDLGDEIGRENLKQLLANLLKNHDVNSKIVEMIVKCTENLITNQEDRLQFFVDIIKDIMNTKTGNFKDFLNNRSLIDELLDKNCDIDLKLRVSSLRVKILDLEEQERNYEDKEEYEKVQKITEKKCACLDDYRKLLEPLLNQASKSENSETLRTFTNIQQPTKVTTEEIVKCLQISFYMIASKKVSSLTPNVCELYKNTIRRHIESNTIFVRNWALKCGTAYSMLYDQLAKAVYSSLYSQFFKNQNISIWNTSIDCLFELIDRYGFDHFENSDKQKKNKTQRQLYNTLEFLDVDDDVANNSVFQVDVIFMMSHILDTCEHVCILRAIIKGMCRLVLHGHIKNDDIMEKLLLKYFNPGTEPEINQILGMFYRNLIKKKKQEYLQPCLLPTINTILTAPYDSPLHEIKPDSVIRFVVDATRPQFCSVGLNIHNTIALSFMQEMLNNLNNKELVKILSKELFILEMAVSDDGPLRNDLGKCCEKLLESDLDPKPAKDIRNFKDILNGNYQSELRNIPEGSDEEEEDSDHETRATVETVSNIQATNERNSNDSQAENEKEETQEKDNNKEIADKEDETEINSTSKPSETKTTTQELPASNAPELQNQSTNENTMSIIPNSQGAAEASQVKEIDSTQNMTQNVSSAIPPLVVDNSTPRKTIIESKNDTAQVSEIHSSPPKTPTTFGKDNSTHMRYLRKSLNTRQPSNDNDDGPSMPPKIRIEAKMQANMKGIQEVPRPIVEKIRSQSERPSQIVCVTDSNKMGNRDNENDSNTSSSKSSDSEETIAPSPKAAPTRSGKRYPDRSRIKEIFVRSNAKKPAKESPEKTKSSEVPKTSNTSLNRNNAKATDQPVEPADKSKGPKTPIGRKKIESASLNIKTPNNKKADKSLSNAELSTSKLKTPSRGTKETNKQSDSVTKNVAGISTRSASKREQMANNIMTRKRLSNENISIKRQLSKERSKTSRIPVIRVKEIASSKDKHVSEALSGKNKLNTGQTSNEKSEIKSTTKKTDDKISKTSNVNTRSSNLPVRLRSNRIANK